MLVCFSSALDWVAALPSSAAMVVRETTSHGVVARMAKYGPTFPGGRDSDGECTPNCNFDAPCKYTGTLTFSNGGAGARDVVDNNGVVVAAGVPVSGAWGPAPVSVASGCGATGDAAGQYRACIPGGGATTSAYMFYGTGCFEP